MARPKSFAPADVIERAMLLFWRRGFHASSIDLIITSAGIGRQSLYDTFGDKETLFAAAVAAYDDRVLGPERGLLQADDSPGACLRNLFARWTAVASNSDIPAGCLLTNSLIEITEQTPNPHAAIVTVESRLRGAIRHSLEMAVEAGELNVNASPEHLADQLVCVRHGIMVSKRRVLNAGFLRAQRDLLNRIIE